MVSAKVVDAVCVPEVPVTVTVEVPAATLLAAVNVRTLDEVAGLVAKAAVTPVGRPDAASMTEPVNVPVSVILMVAGPLEPAAMESAGTAGVSTKFADPEPAVTVSAMVVEAVSVPDVPVIVMVLTPAAAVLATTKIIPLVPVVGLASSDAVTPVGRPEMASVTAPVNPFASSTLMVSLTLVLCAVDNVAAEAHSEKLPAVDVTANEMWVVAVSVPDVPVIVTEDVPAVAVLAAVKVMMLAPVVGLVPKAAVTPVGRPVAASVTLPAKPPIGVTVMVSVPVLPVAMESEAAEGARVKPAAEAIVKAIAVVAVSVPDVQVMVRLLTPMAAVLAAVTVSKLEVLNGLVPKDAVTPAGKPEMLHVMLPVNPFRSVAVMVSVPLELGARVSAAAEGATVKAGPAVIVTAMVVVEVREPEVPVIVTVEVPTGAVILAESVSTLVVAVGLVANEAVTPVGRPDAERVTDPANGLTSATVMVTVQLPPCGMVQVVSEGLIVKLPDEETTVRGMVVVAVVVPEVPVRVTE
jgi:hypothetical protein